MQKVVQIIQSVLADTFTRKFLLIAELLLGIIFVVLKLKLPLPPTSFPISTGAFVALGLFFVCVIITVYIDKSSKPKGSLEQAYVFVIIISLALFAFIHASQPVSKTHLDAASYTLTQRTAAATGNEAANMVKSEGVSESEALGRIEQKYQTEPEAMETAKESFQLTLETNTDSSTVLEKVAPTVPVRIGEWTCNRSGCSYADETYIWTATNANRMMTSALIVFAVTILFWVVNGEYIAKSVAESNS